MPTPVVGELWWATRAQATLSVALVGARTNPRTGLEEGIVLLPMSPSRAAREGEFDGDDTADVAPGPSASPGAGGA